MVIEIGSQRAIARGATGAIVTTDTSRVGVISFAAVAAGESDAHAANALPAGGGQRGGEDCAMSVSHGAYVWSGEASWSLGRWF